MNKSEDDKQLLLLKPQKRVIVFIDGNNLFHAALECQGTYEINIHKLALALCNKNRGLEQIRYYYSPFIATVNQNTYLQQQQYVQKISKIPNIFIVLGRYEKRHLLIPKSVYKRINSCPNKCVSDAELEGYVEKLTDVNIAVDMLIMAVENKYDTAILVSGDADFVPVVRIVKSMKGKKVQVAAFENSLRKCYHLKNEASSFIRLDWYMSTTTP